MSNNGNPPRGIFTAINSERQPTRRELIAAGYDSSGPLQPTDIRTPEMIARHNQLLRQREELQQRELQQRELPRQRELEQAEAAAEAARRMPPPPPPSAARTSPPPQFKKRRNVAESVCLAILPWFSLIGFSEMQGVWGNWTQDG